MALPRLRARRGKPPSAGIQSPPNLLSHERATWFPALALSAAALVLLATIGCGSDETATPRDETSPYFDLDRVLDIAIEIDPEDWETLRHQTRTFEDLMAEIEKYQLSRPFADIYTWFRSTVTVDGETYEEVGIRKKGFLGSQSDEKPSLKLRFDKYVDDQALGGVMERMTLNNSVQDRSMVNTCLALQVFAKAGIPASRCSFATISVNGQPLGLYLHVEELKQPFLEHHFTTSEGNLYEGTVSDFTPEFRGTIEKKNNEDEDDWSDIDAVVAALQDPSEAGLTALSNMVDLDSFLTFWAVEVLVGHWDGYAGNRNNYQFYREPDGRFVFIPWGVDSAFLLQEDPNPFDGISKPPPSVLAFTAIPYRLYHDDNWRDMYVSRMKQLLDTVWDEDELLRSVDALAAVVQQHALPKNKAGAAVDAERVRQFILKRRAEILEDLMPVPPAWPTPEFQPEQREAEDISEDEYGTLTVHFETNWESVENENVFEQGKVSFLEIDGEEINPDQLTLGVLAGYADKEEQALLPNIKAATIVFLSMEEDYSVSGFSLVLPIADLTDGTTLIFGRDQIAGGVWWIPVESPTPTDFIPFREGQLQLVEASTSGGGTISGTFSASWGNPPDAPPPAQSQEAEASTEVSLLGLVINEIAAQGEPLDWFELHNSSDSYLALANFVMADDLSDPEKRVAFPDDLLLPPGGYLRIELDKDGWPGFALGRDEELGIWTTDGTLVAQVDWEKGQADEGTSYARVPDVTGNFQTVSNPTPGSANQAD
ncbi:MAG: hypothetical protein CL897_01435 [Dehalococcoidia bacterium]|nr:hypothetical protein [Dehalococcoidia bacterium]|tara:strand:+ start:3514 stop:5817 length:2304 start_codon:yes stop_codon:yes gene_type:complete